MKIYTIEVSQNDWEYTGIYRITCEKQVEKISERTIRIDDNIIIDFDEEVYIGKRVILS